MMKQLRIDSLVLKPSTKIRMSPKLPRNMIRTSAETLHTLFVKSFEMTTNAKPRMKKRLFIKKPKDSEDFEDDFSRILSSSRKPMHIQSPNREYKRPDSSVFLSNYTREPLKLFCHRKVLKTPVKKSRLLDTALVGVKTGQRRLKRKPKQVESIHTISRCSSLSQQEYLLTPKLANYSQ